MFALDENGEWEIEERETREDQHNWSHGERPERRIAFCVWSSLLSMVLSVLGSKKLATNVGWFAEFFRKF